MQSPFSIFSFLKQSHNSFKGKESGENVVLLLRRHPFFILIRLAFSIVLFFVPTIVGVIFSDFISSHNFTDLFLFLNGIWFLLLWQTIFYSLTMYTLNVWIVTDRRIIDSTQNGFFNRTVSELHLSRVQDVSVNTKGVIPTLLHFGNLQIQTAGTEEKFLFIQVPNPESVKDRIMKMLPPLTTPYKSSSV